ncbi:hypothetical protein M427DRAFT_502583 [Gonapodya prolifera JEL478]|uniref:F-box domain-containing protein n=1 Tax=Gonapodya prolifera (strain JEL478) TaxID=1344416 RepID=A0A139A663_GONPJ|nr:hypothetical protein M427DRAFT_502583 [Gonapodya prolifera JEL478]|eukprot:KXS12310.1 hypothetical protein M427DRAFT_502583 [Gonapodya prolifera JEL478]
MAQQIQVKPNSSSHSLTNLPSLALQHIFLHLPGESLLKLEASCTSLRDTIRSAQWMKSVWRAAIGRTVPHSHLSPFDFDGRGADYGKSFSLLVTPELSQGGAHYQLANSLRWQTDTRVRTFHVLEGTGVRHEQTNVGWRRPGGNELLCFSAPPHTSPEASDSQAVSERSSHVDPDPAATEQSPEPGGTTSHDTTGDLGFSLLPSPGEDTVVAWRSLWSALHWTHIVSDGHKLALVNHMPPTARLHKLSDTLVDTALALERLCNFRGALNGEGLMNWPAWNSSVVGRFAGAASPLGMVHGSDSEDEEDEEDEEGSHDTPKMVADRSDTSATLQYLEAMSIYQSVDQAVSLDWNVENYKWDLMYACSIIVTILGRRGVSARLWFFAESTHCYWHADDACVVGVEVLATVDACKSWGLPECRHRLSCADVMQQTRDPRWTAWLQLEDDAMMRDLQVLLLGDAPLALVFFKDFLKRLLLPRGAFATRVVPAFVPTTRPRYSGSQGGSQLDTFW